MAVTNIMNDQKYNGGMSMLERRMISSGFVEDALDCLRQRNIDPSPALARANISLDHAGDVSNEQYGTLWLEVAALCQDEFLVWALGPCGLAALSSYVMLFCMRDAGACSQARADVSQHRA